MKISLWEKHFGNRIVSGLWLCHQAFQLSACMVILVCRQDVIEAFCMTIFYIHRSQRRFASQYGRYIPVLVVLSDSKTKNWWVRFGLYNGTLTSSSLNNQRTSFDLEPWFSKNQRTSQRTHPQLLVAKWYINWGFFNFENFQKSGIGGYSKFKELPSTGIQYMQSSKIQQCVMRSTSFSNKTKIFTIFFEAQLHLHMYEANMQL